MIPDAKIPIATGDTIERTLPSGIVERFVVTDPGFHQGIHGIQSHYQVKFRRADARPNPNGISAIHISGHNARVNLGSTDNSTNTITQMPGGNATDLAGELKALRLELLSRAGEGPEQYSAIGAVATAESAAKEGDEGAASSILQTLGKSAEWVLTAAKDLGLRLATEYITKHLG